MQHPVATYIDLLCIGRRYAIRAHINLMEV